MPDFIEYRVREVPRFILTRFESTDGNGVSKVVAEFANADEAREVGHALAFKEREALDWPPGDDRIRFPTAEPSFPLPVPPLSPLFPPGDGVS